MGYDVHITRADHWAHTEEHPISAEEWLAMIASDDELTRRESAFSDGIDALWNGPSEYPDPWFAWRAGCIFTTDPDAPMLEQMSEMARRLGAMVQGEDGEIYYDHRQLDRVYAVVRVFEAANPAVEIAVVKVLRSQTAAQAEAARLAEIYGDIGMSYFVAPTRLQPP